MSAPHDDSPAPAPESGDREGTRYGAAPGDGASTRYSDAPAPPEALAPQNPTDPQATRYPDRQADTPGSSLPPAVPSPTAPILPFIPGYEVLAELGRGGMGVVYKAQQLTPARVVALKVIRSGQLATEEDVRLFRQEATEAARLDHSNIVPVYEVGEHNSLHYFTMKLIEGGCLSQSLERYHKDLKAAARLTATLARAVHYAHQRQLLHRDLKPGNILVDLGGQPHVADFGLAKRMGGTGDASQSAVKGTPEYMAPEQARGDTRLTTAVDVYGLGGVLYALLTGRPPFREASPYVTIAKLLSGTPAPPPSQHRQGIPRDLEAICVKCLAKAPEKRYGSAEALAEDLEHWLKSEPGQARQVGWLERVWLWRRRNPATAGLLGALMGALLLGTGVSTYFAYEARQSEKKAQEAYETLQNRNREVEELLAVGLLRPMGNDPGRVADPEIETLWDLAKSNQRVRLLFIECGLKDHKRAGQLRNRADMAVATAVGLDPEMRRNVETMLLTRLHDKESDFDLRTDCAQIGTALGSGSPDFVEAAARQLMEALAKAPRSADSRVLSESLTALTPRLGLEGARRIADDSVKALERRDNIDCWPALAETLSSLAPRLGPDQAYHAAVRVALDMSETHDAASLRALAEALPCLTRRVKSEWASKLAFQALDAINKIDDDATIRALGEASAALGARLEPEEAAIAADKVFQAMSKTEDARALGVLGMKLTALAPSLEPEAAYSPARLALKAMARAHDADAQQALARALAGLAPRLAPDRALEIASQAQEALAKVADGDSLRVLAVTLSALAPRLEPKEAAEAADQVVQAMGKTDDADALCALADARSALAPQVKRDEAARRLAEAARRYIKEIGDMDNVAPSRSAKSAGARLAVEDVDKAEVLSILWSPPHALAVLAPRLGAAEASSASTQALETMGKARDADTLRAMAETLSAVAPQLEPEEAARQASEAALRLTEVLRTTDDADDLGALAAGLAALAPRLGPEATSAAVQSVVEAMGKTMDGHALQRLAGAAGNLVVKVDSVDYPRRLNTLALGVGNAIDPSTALAAFGPSAEASRPLPGRISEQQLVDLLKMPTCRQPAREVLVRQLGWQCGQTFANQWEFVEWAQKNRPDLNLTSPPIRPTNP